jgi:Holliday junction resolvase|tara:strand:+ start:13299 stop:13625 length:327 start_codon:yes stop_codon:yes gene_type:complete
MKEQDLVKLIIDYLLLKGHFVWRNNTGLTKAKYINKQGIAKNRVWRSGVPGSSDILGISQNGKFIAVECKIGKNRPTEKQQEFLGKIRGHGGYAIVAHSLEDVEKYFQ